MLGGPAGLWYGQLDGLECPMIPNGITWQSGVMKPLSSRDRARMSTPASTAWRANWLLNGFWFMPKKNHQLEFSGIAW